MSGAICAIFILFDSTSLGSNLTWCDAKSSTWLLVVFPSARARSGFRVGDRRQQRDLGATRIHPSVLQDDRDVGFKNRRIVGVTRDRLRIVEIVEAQVQRTPGADRDAVRTDWFSIGKED